MILVDDSNFFLTQSDVVHSVVVHCAFGFPTVECAEIQWFVIVDTAFDIGDVSKVVLFLAIDMEISTVSVSVKNNGVVGPLVQ